MPANPALQARAGRNVPIQSEDTFDAARGFFKRLAAVLAPGVDVKVAEGGPSLLGFRPRAFIGANAGAATLDITLTIRRNSDGAVFATELQALVGSNASVDFNFGDILPEGFSLWLNATLTAGVYGNDAVFNFGQAHSTGVAQVGPTDLQTTLTPVFVVDAGYAKISQVLQILNRDSIAHDYEVYLSDALGDTLVAFGNVLAGGNDSVNFGAIFNSGESLKARILLPIATLGRSVTIIGFVTDTNQFEV